MHRLNKGRTSSIESNIIARAYLMKIKGIILGILVGIAIGITIEYLYVFLLLYSPGIRSISILPFGICEAVAGLAGGCIAILIQINRKVLTMQIRRLEHLPNCAAEFITLVIGKMRYRKKVQADVAAELTAHFEDELRSCKNSEEKEQKAKKIVEDFGDAKLLATLLRRAKKRCRPLWRTIVVRTFQTSGVLILLFAFYTTWFLFGRPVISVDYLEIINRMSRPQITDADNAWPHYEKAFSLFVEPDEELKKSEVFENYRRTAYKSFANLPEKDRNEIRKWVEQNNKSLQEFAAGGLKPYSYRKVEYNQKDKSDKMLSNILLLHFEPLRYLAEAGIWRSRMEIEKGHLQKAVMDCLAVVRTGKHFQENQMSTTEQLFGSSMARLGFAEIVHIASTQALAAEDLEQLRQQLTKIYPDGYPLTNYEGEKILFLDAVQHLFTDGGPGGGHLIPKRLWYLGTRGIRNPNKFDIIPFTAISMIHIRRDETIKKANEIFDQLSKTIKISPCYKHINKIKTADEILWELPNYRYGLLHRFLPSFDIISKLTYQGRTQYEATLTILALQQWRKENGNYPETLNKLVESGYLKELPMDPWSDKPLVYRRTEDNFILYSVGLNFTDDGGNVYWDEKGNRREDEGDIIYWPIPKTDHDKPS